MRARRRRDPPSISRCRRDATLPAPATTSTRRRDYRVWEVALLRRLLLASTKATTTCLHCRGRLSIRSLRPPRPFERRAPRLPYLRRPSQLLRTSLTRQRAWQQRRQVLVLVPVPVPALVQVQIHLLTPPGQVAPVMATRTRRSLSHSRLHPGHHPRRPKRRLQWRRCTPVWGWTTSTSKCRWRLFVLVSPSSPACCLWSWHRAGRWS